MTVVALFPIALGLLVILDTTAAFQMTMTTTTSSGKFSFTRRTLFVQTTTATAVLATAVPPAFAAAQISSSALVSELETSVDKLQSVPDLLEKQEWDRVRTILKTPPINKLWNLGESQNTLVQLAKETGVFELLEIKDELAISLQICDQLTYDNAFVYYQPGNGKVKIKEPQALAKKAVSQINDAIALTK